jgi:hypothetical protein
MDVRAWRTATISAPFVVQAVLALLFVNMWLLGKWPFVTHSAYAGERAWMLTATLITTVVSFGVSVALQRSPSSHRRGLSLSIAGSSAIVFIGAVFYAYLSLR